MEEVLVTYLGEKAYNPVLQKQEEVFQHLISEKVEKGESHSDMELILCQHKPVYTLGKNGKIENLLQSARSSGAEFVHTNRGGDITFHGPGQLVGYPILDLERLGIGLAKYIELLEDSIIKTIESYGLAGGREQGASGVWLHDDKTPFPRKICALGIRSSRFVTMHGFAFNINTDLKYFDLINPCGYTDKGVTSLSKELDEEMDFEKVMNEFIGHFSSVFNVNCKSVEYSE